MVLCHAISPVDGEIDATYEPRPPLAEPIAAIIEPSYDRSMSPIELATAFAYTCVPLESSLRRRPLDAETVR